VGGTGKDLFDFNLAAESGITPGTRDVIGDFRRSQADKIDLRGIDARDTPAGDQAFNFIGTKAFTGQEGQLRYALQGNTTIIIGSTDTDKAAEFSIQLTGKIGLLAGDFLL
jgi:serralysin